MSNNAIAENGAAIINRIFVPPGEFQMLYYLHLSELAKSSKEKYFTVRTIVELNKSNSAPTVRTLLLRLKEKQLVVSKQDIRNNRTAVFFSLSSEARLFFKNIDPELLKYANTNNNSR
jgi:hypothetical protein